MVMVYQLKAYGSVAELLGSVSIEIEQTRRHMDQVREASNDIRKRSERSKRLQQAFLNGSKPPTPMPSQGIKMGDLDIVVNAGAEDQILALELMMRAQTERVGALQKIQESLTKLESRSQPELLNEISCLVIESDGVPRKLMFQDKSHFESAAMSTLFQTTAHGFTPFGNESHPEDSKLGEAQLTMASIASECRSDDHEDHRTAIPEDGYGERQSGHEASSAHSDGHLGKVLRFVTAKPITP